MTNHIAIRPTTSNIESWSRTFVPELVLWWWDDSSVPWQQHAVRVVDRPDHKADPVLADITYVNAFHSWVMPAKVQQIIIDDGRWISSLSDAERAWASLLQVQFRRGLCIPRNRFPTDLDMPNHAIANDRVVLDQSLWASLPQSVRRRVIETGLPEWDRDFSFPIPPDTPAHIAGIANSFVHQEGINCLSVTAFAITADRSDLEQWMFPEVFEEILGNHGYEEYDGAAPQPDNIIVLRDEDNIVHAAYALESDRILNKNGQTSFNPIAIIDFQMLIADWEKYAMVIYRRT